MCEIYVLVNIVENDIQFLFLPDTNYKYFFVFGTIIIRFTGIVQILLQVPDTYDTSIHQAFILKHHLSIA